MRAGLITGAGSYDRPALSAAWTVTVSTRYGDVDLTEGAAGDAEIVHLARHGTGHGRLSHQVQHRAASDDPRIAASKERLQACLYTMAYPETGELVPALVQHSVLDRAANAALRTVLPMPTRRAGA